MRNVFVMVDFSDVNNSVIRVAESFARSVDCKLWFVHIVAPDFDVATLDADVPLIFYFQDIVQHDIDRTYTLAEEARNQGIMADAIILESGNVHDVIEASSKRHADLIIAGSHGHGVIYKSIMGSFCDDLIQLSECPVLICPTQIKKDLSNCFDHAC